MQSARSVIGAPARGNDFWGREAELSHLWQALHTGSVLLSAPRRFGKTSLMLRLMDDPKPDWQVFYLNTEWIEGPEDFVSELMAQFYEDKRMQRFWEKAKQTFGKAFERIEDVDISGVKLAFREHLKTDWQDRGKGLIALLEDAEDRILFLIDELPILVLRIAKNSGTEAASEFLHWFRGIRTMPELQERVHWVTGGSISINKVLQHIGAGSKAINDLQMIPVREYSIKQAKAHIKSLLTSEGLKRVPGRVLEKFLNVIEIPIPYFVQILVRESLNEMERCDRKSLDETLVETAYKNGVLAVYNRTYFEHFYERLSESYDPSTSEVAKRLLTEVARRGKVPRKDLKRLYVNLTQGREDLDAFSYLLSELENDFYLIEDSEETNSYRFATKVLRDWWRKYHI